MQHFIARSLLAGVTLLGLLLTVPSAHAFSQEQGGADLVEARALPREARETLALIRAGGPFPFARKDGSVFSNREHALPKRPRGFYHEYTVPTPGAHDRGARRIITGPGTLGDTEGSAEYWYTDDHYRTFRRITDISRRASP